MSFSPDEIQSLVERVEASQKKARRRTTISILVPTIAAILYLAFTCFLIIGVQNELEEKKEDSRKLDQKIDQKIKQINQLEQQINQLEQRKAGLDQVIVGVPQEYVKNAYNSVPGLENQAPLIYLQIQSPSQLKAAELISKELQEKGYIIPKPEVVARGPANSQVRYFRKTDRAKAENVVKILTGLEVRDKVIPQFIPDKSAAKHLEIWFGPKFQ
ncbi:hypothetical protein BST81_12270 [Leptolyngbya sp. 'hensonii']|uniref:hypothetical protein n=1 Tax=Leptolyngbya sp. 'hensonii' TaxID=1922337 RepID=UPI0009500A39|nr:hypothetical protein [Leptolyngbya sp. 'hensonii']OLP17834.1 hypothetical protein BST81_12270 [Leptolyngbya sp. 'hensonii']